MLTIPLEKLAYIVTKAREFDAEVPPVGKKTVVQAAILKDGSLATTEVSMSSGKKGWDAAALKAVKAAAPFDPLPAGFAYPSVQVHFHVSVVP